MNAGLEEEPRIEKHNFFFNAFLCHICKKRESYGNSKSCSGCKLISYCCTEHQKAHWKSHKAFCLAARKICRDLGVSNVFSPGYSSNPLSKREWCQKRWDLKTLFESCLDKDLQVYELNMLFFPKVCKICYTPDIKKELTCTKCLSASYCSEDHKNSDSHENICTDFTRALDMDLFMHSENLDSLQIDLMKPGSKLDTGTIESFIANHMSGELSFGLEALISQYYSSVLTLIHIFNQTPNFMVGKRLNIHLVGAHFDFEYQITQYWENLLHVFPELQSVTVIHIGPELENNPSILRLCDDCWNTNKAVQLYYHCQFYHEYYDGSAVVKPDVIVSLNCGLHQFENSASDSWKLSLPLFLKYENVPVILTAYTKEEAEKDLRRLQKESVELDKKITLISNAEKNPFSSLRPIKDWENSEDSIFYVNSFVSAFIVEKDE